MKNFTGRYSMKHPVTIGVGCLARKTFDYNAAAEIYEKIRNEFSSVGMVKVKGSERMISLFRLREPVQKRK